MEKNELVSQLAGQDYTKLGPRPRVPSAPPPPAHMNYQAAESQVYNPYPHQQPPPQYPPGYNPQYRPPPAGPYQARPQGYPYPPPHQNPTQPRPPPGYGGYPYQQY